MSHISFDALPDDILLSIFAHATPLSIRRCSQVCRTLQKTIAASDHLQYLLELDVCGYIVPLRPRTDLSYVQKTEILRKHNSRWNNLGAITPEYHELPGGLMEPGLTTLVAGTFVWTEASFFDFTRFSIYQLPSNNTGALSGVRRFEVPFGVQYLAIDPEQDVIAFLQEYTTTQSLTPYQIIHLRAASTNGPHPRAARDQLIVQKIYDWCWTSRVTLFGSSLAGVFGHEARAYSYVVIWNWMTGQEIWSFDTNRSSSEYGFDLLSQSSFVSSRVFPTEDASSSSPEAVTRCLQVYQFDPNGNVSIPPIHCASFELPGQASDAGYLSDVYVRAETSTHSQPNSQRRPRIYDTDPNDRLLWIASLGPSSFKLCLPVSKLLELSQTSTNPVANRSALKFAWDDWVSFTFSGDVLDFEWPDRHGDTISSQRFVSACQPDSPSTTITVADLNQRRLRMCRDGVCGNDHAHLGGCRKPKFDFLGNMSKEKLLKLWEEAGGPDHMFWQKIDDEHLVAIIAVDPGEGLDYKTHLLLYCI
ncbi:F-box-like protein [Ceratobasidium sp. AG-Ba]|nr:F-box-like protein [Ceratobasidium sp. AG-Ba]QRW08024.1 F-box-like protein [Ceratobasidium sp. AG-Ba]